MSALIQFEKGLFGSFGHITLQRPKALNALNLEMILGLSRVLDEWEKDPSVLAVIIQSSDERAFCAGGDIRTIYELGMKKDTEIFTFFKQEYALNQKIARYTKPYISFMNGITMGGGVGISLHGSHCVAGKNFQFAMPETGIGFFPDIGSSYLLNRCPGAFGMYLGLSGARLNAQEAYDLKLVNYCIEDNQPVIEALHQLNLEKNAHQTVTDLLSKFHKTPSTSSSITHSLPWINEIFSQNSVEDIIKELTSLTIVEAPLVGDRNNEQVLNPDLIKKTLEDLKSKSPFSLKVTFELLKRTRGKTVEESLAIDSILVQHFLKDKDFYEGVRALLVDKDKQPKWEPPNLESISAQQVNEYFKAN